MAKRVVLWDGNRPSRAGAFVEEDAEVRRREHAARDLATLPVEEGAIHGAVTGYARRDWGALADPWRDLGAVQGMRPVTGWPLLMWVPDRDGFVHYAVKVVHVPAQKVRPAGLIRLVSGSPALGAMTGGLSVVDPRYVQLDGLATTLDDRTIEEGKGLGEPCAWVLKGRVAVHVQLEGYLSLALYVEAQGVHIEWVAATLSPREA